MNKQTWWLAIPTALAIGLGTIETALSQTVAVSPNSRPIELSGMSGGGNKDKSCAGFIAAAPNHTIQVTADSSLQFTLQAAGGQPALLIRGANGQDFCVPADSLSGGKIQIPGRWSKGNYSIFVGDRANGRHSYTLTISPS